MQRNWIVPSKISQVGVGGVFGEDYLRIDASHTLEVARVVEIDGHANGYPTHPNWGHLQKEDRKRIRQSVYSFLLPKSVPEATLATKKHQMSTDFAPAVTTISTDKCTRERHQL